MIIRRRGVWHGTFPSAGSPRATRHGLPAHWSPRRATRQSERGELRPGALFMWVTMRRGWDIAPSLQPGRRGRVAAGDLKPGAYAYADTCIMRNYAESCKPFLWGGRRGSDAGASYPAPRPADQFAVRPAARTPRAALVSPAARTPRAALVSPAARTPVVSAHAAPSAFRGHAWTAHLRLSTPRRNEGPMLRAQSLFGRIVLHVPNRPFHVGRVQVDAPAPVGPHRRFFAGVILKRMQPAAKQLQRCVALKPSDALPNIGGVPAKDHVRVLRHDGAGVNRKAARRRASCGSAATDLRVDTLLAGPAARKSSQE